MTAQRKAGVSWFLKLSTVGERTIEMQGVGSMTAILCMSRKNAGRSLLQCICTCMWDSGFFLVLESASIRGIWWNDNKMVCYYTSLPISRTLCSLRWNNGGMLRVPSISVTLLVLHVIHMYMLQIYHVYRAVRRWTFSILFCCSVVWGSKTVQEYFSLVRTSTWYAWVLICVLAGF